MYVLPPLSPSPWFGMYCVENSLLIRYSNLLEFAPFYDAAVKIHVSCPGPWSSATLGLGPLDKKALRKNTFRVGKTSSSFFRIFRRLI